MAFQRDHGTCCAFVPLKLGVGIIAMLVFAHSMVCILALITDDIRFQANGYNQSLYRLPSAIGSLGLVLGFVGLMGAYDEKPGLLKAFSCFLFAKLAAMAAAAVADYWTLRHCEGWLASSDYRTAGNVQMDRVAEAHVCPNARSAYLLGAGADLALWAYLAVRSFVYQWQLDLNELYPIDFGNEQFDREARWRLYQVKVPNFDQPRRPVLDMGALEASEGEKTHYGSTEPQQPPPTLAQEDPEEASYLYSADGRRRGYAPDGFRV